jgi:hypothetical protein
MLRDERASRRRSRAPHRWSVRGGLAAALGSFRINMRGSAGSRQSICPAVWVLCLRAARRRSLSRV